MALNYVRKCAECGGKSMKNEFCAKCRDKKKEPFISREMTNARAEAIISLPREEALERLQTSKDAIRVLGVDCPESVWHEMRQMKAILNREQVTEETLI